MRERVSDEIDRYTWWDDLGRCILQKMQRPVPSLVVGNRHARRLAAALARRSR
jgi:hypothetical protein